MEAVGHLPVIHSSVDFIFLSFGIMDLVNQSYYYSIDIKLHIPDSHLPF